MTVTRAGPPEMVTVAGSDVAVRTAFTIVAGYCLGEEHVGWYEPAAGVGGPPAGLSRGAFAYRTYDCIAASSGAGLDPIDVLVADGLNAQMRARDIAGVLAVAEDVSSQLAVVEPEVTFWNLPREAVTDRPVDETDPAWPMWRAWTILMGVDGIDVARAHKILHHKRPAVFPLIDNQTIEALGRTSAWAAIHDDLTATADEWTLLESAVATLLEGRDLPSLTRLRLHDILLWTRATGREQAALDLGDRTGAAWPEASPS